jgi:hypothetical protein
MQLKPDKGLWKTASEHHSHARFCHTETLRPLAECVCGIPMRSNPCRRLETGLDGGKAKSPVLRTSHHTTGWIWVCGRRGKGQARGKGAGRDEWKTDVDKGSNLHCTHREGGATATRQMQQSPRPPASLGRLTRPALPFPLPSSLFPLSPPTSPPSSFLPPLPPSLTH